ncbi:MAG: TlpA family protein disulfide reductase [Clostridiales bacterium]|nr:TlpA family protein disulfide reductase [Clostridiales bacterium]
MRKLTAALIAVVVLLSGCGKAKTDIEPFLTYDLDKNEITQEIFSNKKLTMLNVWATFCSPCLEEMPYLSELSVELASSNVQILGLVADVMDQKGGIISDQVNYAQQLVLKTGALYTHLLPSDGFLVDLLSGVYAVPTTFFFDTRGNQVGEPVLGGKNKMGWEAEINARLELLNET